MTSSSSRTPGRAASASTETWQAVRPVGPRHDHLHVGDHGPAQGRRADARQRDGAVRGERRAHPADARRAGDVLPAERPRRRPLDLPLVGVAHARLHRHLDRRHADGDPHAPRPAADHLGRRAADLGEAPAHARRAGRRGPLGADRAGARRAAGAARPRPRRAPRRRRGADADRRAALLRRPRPADRRGCGGCRRPRARRRRTRPAPSATARAAPRCPGVELRLAATASCSCAGRSSCAATATTPRRPRPRSTTTAGCAPATSPTIDDDGYVSIVDRKKELIISSGGKNMSPGEHRGASSWAPRR